jgi:hypothetical protein
MPFSEAVKLEVKKRANFTCCWCLDRQRKVEIHHIVPQAEGGPDEIDNAAPLCRVCHDQNGGNPQYRKEIRQRRDHWYESCAKGSGDAQMSEDNEPLAAQLQPPVFRTMAPGAEGFVWRPEHAELVTALTRDYLEDDRPQTVAITTALRGAGGFGKTTLAQALCEHEAVRESFPAGILWTTLGQKLTEADRIARIRDLLRWWTRKEPLSFETVETASAELRDALSGQRLLLVLDDVWLSSDLAPFTSIGAPATLLVTTRNTRVLPPTAHQVIVDALELTRAIELLGLGLSPLPPRNILERLAGRLGEWPILLKLVNAQLREEYRDGVAAKDAFRRVELALDEVGLTAFDREDEEARNFAVQRTVEASLQRLSSQDRHFYARLAVFPEDEGAPLAVVGLLWRTADQETRKICRRWPRCPCYIGSIQLTVGFNCMT